MSSEKCLPKLASKALSRRAAGAAGKTLWKGLSEAGSHLEYRTGNGQRRTTMTDGTAGRIYLIIGEKGL